MATFDLTSGSTALSGRFEGYGYVMEKEIDFTLQNVSATNTVAMLAIPAGTLVASAGVECLTVEGGTATAEFGDTTDPNGWAASVNLNSAANNLGAGAYVVAGGKLYTAATDLELLCNNNQSVGKARVWAVCYDVGNRKLAQHSA